MIDERGRGMYEYLSVESHALSSLLALLCSWGTNLVFEVWFFMVLISSN